MKTLSEKQALVKLREIKNAFRTVVAENYEHRAKNCLTCDTRGICCLDAHFVNVRISRLEAVAIVNELKIKFPDKETEIFQNIAETIEKYNLNEKDENAAQTFACPLFEKSVGCTIHAVKPLPCISHACYERAEDLPPETIIEEAENKVARLNERTYRKFSPLLPLPVALQKILADE